MECYYTWSNTPDHALPAWYDSSQFVIVLGSFFSYCCSCCFVLIVVILVLIVVLLMSLLLLFLGLQDVVGGCYLGCVYSVFLFAVFLIAFQNVIILQFSTFLIDDTYHRMTNQI